MNAVYDVSESPDTSLTASGTTGTVTLTAGLKVFNQLLAAGGVQITLTGGLSGVATITQFIDQTRVTATIEANRAFSSTSIPAGKWRLSTNEQRGIRCIEKKWPWRPLAKAAARKPNIASWGRRSVAACSNAGY